MLKSLPALVKLALTTAILFGATGAYAEEKNLTDIESHNRAHTPEEHAAASGFRVPKNGGAPEVKVGGFMNFQAAYADNDASYSAPGTIYSRDTHFANDAEVHVLVEGVSDNGLKYGAVIELEADVTADNRGEGLNADKTYVWAETNLGRVEGGNNEGAQTTMAVNAASIARATGGIDGDDEFYINYFGALNGAPFLIHPDMPTADVGGVTEDATKLTYYSPTLSGLQFGISFTPDEGNGGTASAFTTDADGNYENVVGAGITYQTEVSGVGINIGLVGEYGQNELSTIEDMEAWQLGTVLSYNGFSVAGSYADWQDSYKAVGVPSDDQYFWNLGVAYERQPFGVSATYFYSQRANGVNSDEYRNLVFSADYELAEGLLPYVEVSFFDADAGGTAVDNSGTVVMVGTYLNF